MHNKRWTYALIALAIVASALLAAGRPPAAHFEFELQRTATGVVLKNHYGGDWVSLNGSCDHGGGTCSFVVNEHGIETIPPGAQAPPARE